jgi:MFS family permease
MIGQIGTLIVATGGVQLATGFFGTFMSLRVALENFGVLMAGVVLSSYSAGYTAGAFFCGRIIQRFGHIRAYAACGGLVITATAAMPLIVSPWPWLALRGIIGFGCAGLFVATESWLSAKARPADRGRVFSIYMVGNFLALGLGQLLISRIAVNTTTSFNIIVAIFALALVLVSMTRAEPPRIISTTALPYGRLVRAAPVAVAGAALSGLIASSFYALVPMWMHERGIERETIGLVMLAAVLGGLSFQIPVGRLSDRFDRRVVLTVLGVGLVVAAVTLVYLPRNLPMLLPAAALLGGFMSALYPVCAAHAHDRMPVDRVVAVSSRLILLSGLGAVLGPLAGIELMQRFGINGVLFLIASTAFLLALIAFGSSFILTSPPHLERTFDLLAPQAEAEAHDPRGRLDEPQSR